MKTKILNSLNEQINKELFSSYLYLSMSAYFENKNLPGFANWMRVQAQEEMVHAMKFYSFIIQRGGKVQLKALEGPKNEWASPLNAFEEAYKHEQFITDSINSIVSIAHEEKDYAADNFLQWFISEQVEEEESTNNVVQKLKLVGDGSGLFLLDQELGTRVFTPPPATGAQAN